MTDMYYLPTLNISRFESKDFVIDTCEVAYASPPYETGIKHKRLNDGNWIIVQKYDTLEKAQEGHNKWIKKLNDTPFEQLTLEDVL